MWNLDRRAGSLRQLHTLNRHFITHIIAQHDGDMTASALPPPLIAQLRTLGPAALHELCATPYTLYDLPFASASYWHDAARPSAVGELTESIHAEPESATQNLAQLTLFLAWHLACTDAAGARLLFGMSAGTLAFFQQADVATLSGVATRVVQVLQPRWPTNPCFWPDLIKCAGGDRLRLQVARLLGAQLLASELHDERVVQQLPRRLRLSLRRRASLEIDPASTTALELASAVRIPI